VDWVELEESESATLAGGGAHASASAGLESHWLDWDDSISWAELWRGHDGFLVALANESDGWSSLLWGSWVRLRSDRSKDEKVRWASLSEHIWSGGWFLSESEEGGFPSDHGGVMRESRVRSVNWLGCGWGKSLELHFEYYLRRFVN